MTQDNAAVEDTSISKPKLVFVLGAGFTRAFLPSAPLLVDDYQIDGIRDKYRKFSVADTVLNTESRLEGAKRINLERLLTRLGGLPYDPESAPFELGALKQDLLVLLRNRLERAKAQGVAFPDELKAFARFCVESSFSCITFNYDDLLDEALWKVNDSIDTGSSPHWTPERGYGFFCRPSSVCLRDFPISVRSPSALLLKLHGSVNWRVPRGTQNPYPIDGLVHHESWSSTSQWSHGLQTGDDDAIDLHLERSPFIVPPVLDKSALIGQPILRTVWFQAFKKLYEAEKVFFIGYSCPVTDMASMFFFSQSVVLSRNVRVINLQRDERGKRELFKAYQKVFPDIHLSQFDFRNAVEWIAELYAGNLHR